MTMTTAFYDGSKMTSDYESNTQSSEEVFLYYVSQNVRFQAGMAIHVYVLPIIVLIGQVGNMISLRIMTLKRNRRISCCWYMSGIALCDNVLLLIAAYYWVVTVPFLGDGGTWACKIPVWIFQMFSLTGAYLVLAMTVDRLVAVTWPLKASLLCTPRRAKLAMVVVLVASAVYCIPYLFTANEVDDRTCAAITGVDVLSLSYSWTSTILASVLPFISLMIMNSMIIYSFRNRMKRFEKATETTHQNSAKNAAEIGEKKVTSSRETQLTAMLLLVTFTFLALTLPQYVRYVIFTFIPIASSPGRYSTYILIYNITGKLFFMNNASNFFLYCIGGSKFRGEFVALLCGCRRKGVLKQESSSATQSTSVDKY